MTELLFICAFMCGATTVYVDLRECIPVPEYDSFVCQMSAEAFDKEVRYLDQIPKDAQCRFEYMGRYGE